MPTIPGQPGGNIPMPNIRTTSTGGGYPGGTGSSRVTVPAPGGSHQPQVASAQGYMGNVGAAVTKFVAPWVMVAMGWHAVALIWASVLAATAVLFFLFAKDDPELAARRISGERGRDGVVGERSAADEHADGFAADKTGEFGTHSLEKGHEFLGPVIDQRFVEELDTSLMGAT